MHDEIKKAVEKSQSALQNPFPKERGAFKTLLLSNPNYFGNLTESPFKPIVPIARNSHYEDLGCLGYQPQQERLEAIVYINQPSGYGTDVCGPGTPEYVRFYLSFDNGVTWQDQGMTSFQAFNILEGTEGTKRLEYAVALAVDPPRKLCFFSPLIQARAILSWNNPPPPNQPNWAPVWGDVEDATILVEPRRFFPPLELFEAAKVKLPDHLKEVVDLESPIATKQKSLSVAELAREYRNKGVPAHRFAFRELHAFASSSTTTLSAESLSSLLPGIEIGPDIGDLIFPPTDGSTTFEELVCIGFDPNAPDTLVGIIHVKKSAGYSGGPCTDGSREYVTFWGDFDGNGTLETCLGTASVRVYDIAAIPAGGIYYAVRLPVDMNPYRRPCSEGPRVVRIRATLSWNVPISCGNPDQVPAWGNREETLINIPPASQAPAGKIAILGGIPVSHIDNFSGLTTNTAVFATNNLPPDSLGRPCPFARRVTVQGAPVVGHSYAVEVSQDGVLWNHVVTDLIVTDQDGNTSEHVADPVTKRFDYLPFTQNINSVLAQWDTTGDALWRVRLSVFNGGVLQGVPDVHRIQLDNTAPTVSIEITTGSGDCGKFPVGTNLAGNFVARDDYLGSYSLGVEPAINSAGVGVPVPSSGLVNTAVAPGDGWTLDTTSMKPCGYVIRVVAADRAIVNSQSVGQHVPASAGFCLEAPEE